MHDARKQQRRSIRLPGYDYRQGLFFVTICTYRRQNLFGKVVGDAMVLSPLGQLVAQEWQKTAVIRPNVTLDAWVVMPNHFHGIIQLHPTPHVLAQTDNNPTPHVGASGS
ncbi:MAG: hypothetical protein KC443_24495, partial [Anaerolineales bacterium]|nr:hypothetical protein [Anaerolineales bacterium]